MRNIIYYPKRINKTLLLNTIVVINYCLYKMVKSKKKKFKITFKIKNKITIITSKNLNIF